MSAIVFGALGVVGQAFVSHLAARGLSLVLADLPGAATVAGLGGEAAAHSLTTPAVFCATDATQRDDVQACFSAAIHMAPLGLVINAAGMAERHSWFQSSTDMTETEELSTLLMTITMAELVSRAALRHAHNKPHGLVVIHVASAAAFVPFPSSSYSIAKGAVVALVRSHALLHRVTGVAFTALCPWWIDSPILPAPVKASLRPSDLLAPDTVARSIDPILADPAATNGTAILVRPDATQSVGPEDWPHVTGEYTEYLSGPQGVISRRVDHIADQLAERRQAESEPAKGVPQEGED